MFSTQKLSLFIILILMGIGLKAQEKIPDFRNLPSVQWTFSAKSPFFASPVANREIVYVGGTDSVLYALDIHSGKKIWKFRTNGEIRSNACILGDTLFLNGGDGQIYALNKLNGHVIWKFATLGERKYDFADYFHSTPVCVGGILYFGSGDGHLYAVNAATGNLHWKYKTGHIVHTTPAIDNHKIFFGSFDGFVYSLNLDGSLAWKFKTIGHRYFPVGEVQGSPTVFKNLVFIGARDYNVYAIDQQKGYCHWNKSFVKGWGLNSSIYDSVLYIGSADERVLIAADPMTGNEFWNRKMEFLVFGNCSFSENLLYLGTTIGKFHGISRKSGDKLWSFDTESYLNNRAKYFKSDDSYRDDIYSIIKSNEHFLEVECELGGIFSTPAIFGNYIIFSSANGTIYCLKNISQE
ncbi:MAG: PQQ-binding-like beta-propeller repeat protein [Prolixibacteraceae bacterium]|nr:PQQ-binding-like beta-propeller repeat protein [Prolixibacteraceae bacterium]